MKRSYRPWGHLKTILKASRVEKWDFFGCISTEDRFLSAYSLAKNIVKIANVQTVCIKEEKNQYSDIIDKRITEHTRLFFSHGYSVDNITGFKLLSPRGEVVNHIDHFIDQSCGNIILDISTLPKRFFFVYVKRLFKNSKIKNLLVTNTIPLSYTKNMTENYDYWNALPLFQAPFDKPKHSKFFIGIGHMPMGIADQLNDASEDVDIHLFFPFPGTSCSLNLSWEFLFKIQNELGHDHVDVIRVGAKNTSELFDYFEQITAGGSIQTLLAPFGPKPFSLAMAILATKYEFPVFYTQPRVYNPDYSIGVAQREGLPQVTGYLIKYEGASYY